MSSGETEIAKEKFYAAKKPKKIQEFNFDNVAIPKLVKTNTTSKYLIGYSDKAIRPLVLIMPKMSGNVKTCKVEHKNRKLISFEIDDEISLEKNNAIWTKIEDLKI